MTKTAAPSTTSASRQDSSWVFFNGTVCRYHEAHVGLLTHGLNYGTGSFEGIRAYWNSAVQQLFVLRQFEHYRRMQQSTAILQMKIPHSSEELCNITLDLLRRNDYREDVYIRPLCFKANEDVGVRLHNVRDSFGICIAPMGDYVSTAGLRCMVSSWRRIDDSMAPVRSKTTGLYVNSALAKSEALQGGFDEAIMLSHDGHVSEGSAENLFIVRDARIITPSPSDNILEGITRQTIMHLAAEEMGLEVVERAIDRSELYIADEVFLTGTGAQVAPVIEVDRRPVADAKIGPLTARLQSLYADVCKGRSQKYQDWLTPVY